jgi:protein O-GlcNAc transferase
MRSSRPLRDWFGGDDDVSDTPDSIEEAFQAALKLHSSGKIEEARAAYEAMIAAHPAHARALHSLGVLEKNSGHGERAVGFISRAIALQPEAAEFYNNLGDALQGLNRFDEAAAAFERSIELMPNYVKAYNNLGMLQLRRNRFGAAIAMLLRAIAIQPSYARAIANLGTALLPSGRQEEAIKCFRRAIELEPDYLMAHSNLLMASHYVKHDPKELFEAHRTWGRRFADPVSAAMTVGGRDGDAARLKIGYVSGDFRDHAVTRFFLPVLERHDRTRFHITCYSNVAGGDAITAEIRSRCDRWRDIVGVSDEQAARMVREDGIDILVDLAGHSARNRLMLFAHRPAAVQVTWLGYPNTTGMGAMDFRISDAQADPVGMTEPLNTERLVRLRSAWCYQPRDADVEVAPPPSASGKPVTFGSFNTLAKVTGRMIETWAEVLRGVPQSRMMIKAPAAGDESVRARLLGQFAQHGIEPTRLIVLGKEMNWRRHLESYGEVDVMLDTFPYHGTTMTCEAMWMGVAVVTLAGQSHVSRVGLSLLSSVGMEELVARTRDEYVRIAVELAGDVERLKRVRGELRERMKQSVLMDARGFVAELEDAYREMWTLGPSVTRG